MPCFVYASRCKADTYLWLRQRDRFDLVPSPLREKLGELRFVLEVNLTTDRPLPRENANRVLAHLRDDGWHLQLPPANHHASAAI